MYKKLQTTIERKNIPAAWWLGPSITENEKDAEDYLRVSNWVREEIDICMVCNLSHIKIKTTSPDNFSIVQCNGAEQHDHFDEVLSSIFDPIDKSVKEYYRKWSLAMNGNQSAIRLLVWY